jgi:hypothetical protein
MTDRECVHGSLESLCPTCKTSSDVGGEKSRADLPAYPTMRNPEHGWPTGLTIREHFAAMAMQGMLANPAIPQIARSQGAETHEAIMDWYSQGAVQHADALIAELAK